MRKGNSRHVIFSLLLSFLYFTKTSSTPVSVTTQIVPVNVGVVLDKDDYVAEMGFNCISMALSDFYAIHTNYTTRLLLHARNSKGTIVGAAWCNTLDLLKNIGVQAIIGPLLSLQANVMVDLGEKAQVPIITFSATAPLSLAQNPYFIRFNLNDSSQVDAIAAAIQCFHWQEVVPVYEANEFGEGIIMSLTEALEKVNVRIPYRSLIHIKATNEQIVTELSKLMKQPTRVLIVHMQASLGSRVFAKAKQLGMMTEGYVWIATTSLTNEFYSIDPSVRESMLGVIGIKHYILETKEMNNLAIRYRKRMQQNKPSVASPGLNIYGLWAYDSAVALAIAVEETRTTNAEFHKANISRDCLNLEDIVVSSSGPKLLQGLSNIRFRGLSGNLQLVNGQLQTSAYQIVNVVGPSARVIGYMSKFGSIIWPGDTTTSPKGWAFPTDTQRMRIGVPFTQNGASMVVLTKGSRNPDAWVFLKPLTWELWLTTFCSILFIGFLIWILEHRVNEDFRGAPRHQVGMIFWFSFSTSLNIHQSSSK